MRFAVLGSGSRGNATLVQAGTTTLMVDCGFSLAETEARLTRLGVAPEAIAALLITHEHGDHAAGAASFASRYAVPLWCTAGTRAGCERLGMKTAELFQPCAVFHIGELEITPVTVPHDAREPTQFVFSDGRHRLGLLTDTGSVTPHIRRLLAGCHGLILECNHDRDMLQAGPYPAKLKKRVAGPLGHLSNEQAAELLATLPLPNLQHLVAAHLSEKNNTPELARRALTAALGCGMEAVEIAGQELGLPWRGFV